jgi:uncharacterized protein YcbK (DUF882 family)
MSSQADSSLLPLGHRPYRRFERPGLTPRQERVFNVVIVAIVALFAVGWIYTLLDSRARDATPPLLGGAVTINPLSPEAPPETPYLLDAALRRFGSEESLRGLSGKVRIAVQVPGDTLPRPDSLPGEARLEYAAGENAGSGAASPTGPGVWNLLVRIGDAIRPVPDFAVVSAVPLSEKRGGRIGSYLIGNWPNESGKPRSPAYAPPRGLIRVTPENMNTAVSEHFKLSDFLTKGQQNVWPKYVALSTRLLDKLELTIAELEASGFPVKDVGVISGFRTPQYNAHGGDTGGRGQLSRHMYGDAMDIYIDTNGDGRMDDLNRDGAINFNDAKVLAAAADRVERKYPILIGGVGTYRPTGAHSGFVHIDTRGYRARW